jgi:hypothetical protein
MAKHVSDFKKDSESIVLDLINEQNGTAFSASQVALGEPVAGEGKATTMLVSAKVGSGYRGTYSFQYNRVDLVDVPTLADGTTHEADIEKFSDVVTFLNDKFGLNLSAADLTVDGVDLANDDPIYEGTFDEVKQFALAAKPKSLVWLGTTNLALTPVRQDLGALWTNSTPDGLYPPQDYPDNAYMVQAPDGSVRTTSDGSIRTFAGIDPNA